MPGVVVKFEAVPIRPPFEEEDQDNVLFCPCDFRCAFEEKVFAHESGDGIRNDIRSFLFRKITPSDTVVITLVKNGATLATITDNTYGEYYDSFAAQPLYVGWQADWTKIYDAFSGGVYQVKAVLTVLGVEVEFLSHNFRLNYFDIITANHTVKIETYQDGNLENSEFNFSGLLPDGWYSALRLTGDFGKMQPTIERDVYQDTSNREVQNRDVVNREYKLDAFYVPETIYERLTIRDLLANQIYISSYDVLQDKKYERYAVVPDAYDEVRYDDLGNTHFTITFSDRQKNIIKTNVP